MPRLAETTPWRDALAVHRLEFPFPVNYLCYASWGACFAAGTTGLADPGVIAAGAANLLLIVSGLALNTAVDIRTDEHHHERGYLAEAATRFGRNRLLRWAGAEMALALGLAGLAAGWSGRPVVVAVAALAILLQLLYNVEPIRLKRRGLGGVAAFCASVVVLPFLLSHLAARPNLDPAVWPILAGLGALAIGRMTWWSVPDRVADASTGMRTPSVRYGVGPTLVLAGALMLGGLALLAWGLGWRYGAAWVVPAVVPHLVFLAGAVLPLARGARASSVRMRRRDMPLVVIGELVLAVIPLIAGGGA